MKTRLVVFFIFVGFIDCFACKCIEYSIEQKINISYKKADIIFYGELIKSDTISNSYTFKILELFKGDYKSKTITSLSKSNCDFYFNEKGLCIIYGNFNKNKTLINISACGASQSQNFGPGFPPIPIEFDSNGKVISKNKIEMDLFNLENKNKSLKTFIFQLEKLRQYKQNQNAVSENMKNDFYQKILIVSLIVNAILFLILIFVLIKRK